MTSLGENSMALLYTNKQMYTNIWNKNISHDLITFLNRQVITISAATKLM